MNVIKKLFSFFIKSIYYPSFIIKSRKFGKKSKKLFKKLTQNFELNKKLISLIIEKVLITSFYIIPLLTLSLRVHFMIQTKYPNFIPILLPFGYKIVSNQRFIRFILFSAIFSIYNYIMSSIILSQHYSYLKIKRRVKFAVVMANVLEYLAVIVLEYYEFFAFTYTFTGTKIHIDDAKALIYMVVYIVSYLLYIIFYICSMRGIYPIISDHPSLRIVRKILYSVLFWVRIVPKNKKKRTK
jgi:hypothetical protein